VKELVIRLDVDANGVVTKTVIARCTNRERALAHVHTLNTQAVRHGWWAGYRLAEPGEVVDTKAPAVRRHLTREKESDDA